MHIRPETPQDAGAIRTLTARAFAPMAFSDGTEPAMIDRLRTRGDLHLSLVAEEAGVLGHVAFSPATLVVPGRWFALGPVSVAPKRQRQGLGTALIEAGLARLRAEGATGCVLVGDPGYYGRFGFSNGLGLTQGNTDTAYVQGLAFGRLQPTGEIGFSAAFD